MTKTYVGCEKFEDKDKEKIIQIEYQEEVFGELITIKETMSEQELINKITFLDTKIKSLQNEKQYWETIKADFDKK